MKAKRTFIITDPSYIMNNKQYDKICREDACDFEGQSFPLKSKHRENKTPIIFHTIVGTPNGDGSYNYQRQDIGVDSGMLCIAENKKGWNESFGATFETLKQAEDALPIILENF